MENQPNITEMTLKEFLGNKNASAHIETQVGEKAWISFGIHSWGDVELEGTFTSDELRRIADHIDKLDRRAQAAVE